MKLRMMRFLLRFRAGKKTAPAKKAIIVGIPKASTLSRHQIGITPVQETMVRSYQCDFASLQALRKPEKLRKKLGVVSAKTTKAIALVITSHLSQRRVVAASPRARTMSITARAGITPRKT